MIHRPSVDNVPIPLRRTESSTFSKQVINAQITIGFPVYLNVYHLTVANYFIQIFGLGFFHTSLEINKIEYSFGRTIQEDSGIFYNKFGEGSSNLVLKEKIYLGNTIYNDGLIQQLLILNIPYWLGKSYDPFLKNCNHFTMFLAEKLLRTDFVRKYPEYVNRIVEYGIFLSSYYSPIKRLYGRMLCHPTNGLPNLDEIMEKKEIKENKTIYLQDIKLDIENNNDNNSSRVNENGIQISTQGLLHCKLCDTDAFFNAVIKSNFFIKKLNYQEKNNILYKISVADELLSKNKLDTALKEYSAILQEINNSQDLTEDFIKLFPIGESYRIENKTNNALLKIKIYHCMSYIYYKLDDNEKEENANNSILKLNKDDYYAIFNIGYLKFLDNKFPECENILQNTIKECEDNKFKIYFEFFIKIIDNLEM